MAGADAEVVGVRIDEAGAAGSFYLRKFILYETRSKFYMVGRDKTRTYWKVLKIDRLNPAELSIWEDPTTYSQAECQDLLKMIHEGNRSTGGLKFVTSCYGIIGFIMFLGPYYMLIITKRRQIGSICGHDVYAVSKSEMIGVTCSTTQLDTANSKSENRYKKLLCSVDLTKDFFFSYSYHIMHSLQKNLSDNQKGLVAYETMFVWNGFLTRGIRNLLKNTLWTVALVHGFFKQDTLKISDKEFKLTLIARRSRYYAGTRYQKRGVNEKGRVANDVETEQIVSEDVPGACLTKLTAVVQHRGSIPLFWSQETSRLNIRPDIILQKKDDSYEATKLHFENLVKRYGNPIIIFNLIKKREKKPRESILHKEFANAIDFINKDLPDENRLKFVHWDLHKLSRRKDANVLLLLAKVAAYALTLTDLFYCQLKLPLGLEEYFSICPSLEKEAATEWSPLKHKSGTENSQNETEEENSESISYCFSKPFRLQKGVLRTNCIDCLDRTNVAQFAYGLAAFGHQLHALGLIDVPKVNLDALLAEELMRFYEAMGDTLAMQYGGSGAHNKIFCERRGQWKAATQSQEFLRNLQRYYSNAYMDAEKQDAINVFLGYFQPQQGKPALWELDSDQHYGIGRLSSFSEELSRSSFKRSLSEGNILSKCKTIKGTDGGHELMDPELPEAMLQGGDVGGLPDMTSEIPNDCDPSSSRYIPKMLPRQSFADSDHIYFNELGACGSNCSNFLDLDWLSSSGNSCEDETYERVSPRSFPIEIVTRSGSEEAPVFSENDYIRRVRDATEGELQRAPRNTRFSIIGSIMERFSVASTKHYHPP